MGFPEVSNTRPKRGLFPTLEDRGSGCCMAHLLGISFDTGVGFLGKKRGKFDCMRSLPLYSPPPLGLAFLVPGESE